MAWPPLFDALVLERPALRAGQAWRLWSAHLAHISAAHAALNLGMAALLALFAARLGILPALLWRSLLLMPSISLGLLLGLPQLQWYAGLSGLLHGWAVWLLLRVGGGRARAGFVALGLKLGWEMLKPAPSADALPVVSEAHLLGAGGALLLALSIRLGMRRKGAVAAG